ncbi:peroxide stress protein YaaA [Membranicola marinus]|uniref:UPF0246 protein KUV50_16485 n=1 Tax=Membranihabitans marinus TaxID=1227546 RepID=A0A953HRT4_9BACT|nr:peroxide stress protein YaaA [Membranihabitans marinus]MBY5959753.1 peroxide stress protein YaaA [Membranihabitans marinus]
MIIILSPSKTLRDEKIEHPNPSPPLFQEKTGQLMRKLQRLTKSEVKNLMSISDNLTELNYNRYKAFEDDFKGNNSEPAIFTFKGDVFQGLQAESFTAKDLEYAEPRLYILSGLYGLLKPSTLVQPYRLEMGTPLPVDRNKNLYEFWGDSLTQQINASMESVGSPYLVNLASKEYSKALNLKKVKGEVIDVHFREWRNEKWTFISFNAKKARGTMARYILRNQIEEKEDLKGFDLDGYAFNEELSSENELFFTK